MKPRDAKDEAREPGDRLVWFAAALKLSFVVEKGSFERSTRV